MVPSPHNRALAIYRDLATIHRGQQRVPRGKVSAIADSLDVTRQRRSENRDLLPFSEDELRDLGLAKATVAYARAKDFG